MAGLDSPLMRMYMCSQGQTTAHNGMTGYGVEPSATGLVSVAQKRGNAGGFLSKSERRAKKRAVMAGPKGKAAGRGRGRREVPPLPDPPVQLPTDESGSAI